MRCKYDRSASALTLNVEQETTDMYSSAFQN